ncbi:MAG: PEGA domain-containing protein, partial [Prevotellamassilia sp.]|nr:PEGA domain-containing protein [Prevotellamassilia sp.]
MKAKLLLFFFCLSVLGGMGQGTISRNKCKTCGKVISQCPHKGKHPKTPPKPEPKPKPKPKPQAEEAGYDVTFTCNVSSAALSIDGTNYGAVSGTRFLKTGTHTISLTADGYENYSHTITVNRQNRSFHFTMTEKVNQNLTIRVGDVDFVMVKVSGGTFTMGATSEM